MEKFSFVSPRGLYPEAEYLASAILGPRLGVNFEVEEGVSDRWIIRAGERGRILAFPSELRWSERTRFQVEGWDDPLQVDQLKKLCGEGKVAGHDHFEGMPDLVEFSEEKILIRFDLLSKIWILLSGWTEVAEENYDHHGRHSVPESSALSRASREVPVVDHCVEVFFRLLRLITEHPLARPKSEFRVSPSHDVDWPFLYRAMGVKGVVRRCSGDLVKRQQPFEVPKTLRNWWRCRRGDASGDPFFTFDWVMRQSEKRGLASTFYFIADHSDPTMDGTYDFSDPCILRLLNEIHDRGHQIGLHASYNTFRDGGQIQREFEILRTTCDELGIVQKEWGSRQHFLRWRTPETAIHLAAAGVDFDATLGLAASGGFRHGTCHEFPLYDPGKRRAVGLREKPLILMDCSIIDDRYRGLGVGEEALTAMVQLKNQCRTVGGDFQILWHNDRFGRNPDEFGLYEAILDEGN